MRRFHAFALSTVLVLALPALAPSASATEIVQVKMVDNSFDPSTQTAPWGDVVQWTNSGNNNHTATGDSPLSFWNTGTLSKGEQADKRFYAAGRFPYHCVIHPGMTGLIRVTMGVSPAAGTAATPFSLFIASQDAPMGRVYDVQRKRPGETSFSDFRIGITQQTLTTSPNAPGTYRFRSRLRKTTNGATSGWSPVGLFTVS